MSKKDQDLITKLKQELRDLRTDKKESDLLVENLPYRSIGVQFDKEAGEFVQTTVAYSNLLNDAIVIERKKLGKSYARAIGQSQKDFATKILTKANK